MKIMHKYSNNSRPKQAVCLTLAGFFLFSVLAPVYAQSKNYERSLSSYHLRAKVKSMAETSPAEKQAFMKQITTLAGQEQGEPFSLPTNLQNKYQNTQRTIKSTLIYIKYAKKNVILLVKKLANGFREMINELKGQSMAAIKQVNPFIFRTILTPDGRILLSASNNSGSTGKNENPDEVKQEKTIPATTIGLTETYPEVLSGRMQNSLIKQLLEHDEDKRLKAIQNLENYELNALTKKDILIDCIIRYSVFYADSIQSDLAQAALHLLNKWGIDINKKFPILQDNQFSILNPDIYSYINKIALRKGSGYFFKFFFKPELIKRPQDLDVNRVWSIASIVLRYIVNRMDAMERQTRKGRTGDFFGISFELAETKLEKDLTEFSKSLEQTVYTYGDNLERTVHFAVESLPWPEEQKRVYENDILTTVRKWINYILPEQDSQELKEAFYIAFDSAINSHTDPIELTEFLRSQYDLIEAMAQQENPRTTWSSFKFANIAPFIPRDLLLQHYEKRKKILGKPAYQPLLDEQVDYSNWAKMIIEEGEWWYRVPLKQLLFQEFYHQLQSRVDEIESNKITDTINVQDPIIKFDMYYPFFGENQRLTLLRKIVGLANSGNMSSEGIDYLTSHYSRMVEPFIGMSGVNLSQINNLSQLYKDDADSFIFTINRYFSSLNDDYTLLADLDKDKDQMKKEMIQFNQDMLDQSRDRLNKVFDDNISSLLFKEAVLFWAKEQEIEDLKTYLENRQIKLLTDEEFLKLDRLTNNLPEDGSFNEILTQLHLLILILVERRFLNRTDPVANLISESLLKIKEEYINQEELKQTLTNFLEFCYFISNESVTEGEITEFEKKLNQTPVLDYTSYKALSESMLKKIQYIFHKYSREMFLEKIEFKDGGDALSNFHHFMLDLFAQLPKRKHKRPFNLPVKGDIKEMPIYEGLVLDTELEVLAETSTFFGRTLVYKRERKAVCIKFLKEGEDPANLAYEFDMMNFLRDKKEEWDLKGNYPLGLIRIGAIDSNILPKTLFERSIGGKVGPIQLDKKEGKYTFMIYEVDLDEKGKIPYFTYLNDPDLTHEEFLESLRINVHDRFAMARHGLYDSEIIELFHNQERKRRYDWMVDVKHHQQHRHGAGRLDNVTAATLYPNIRASGPADLPEIAYLQDMIGNRLSRDHADNRISRLLNMQSHNKAWTYNYNFIEAALLGDTLLSLFLIIPTYLERREELESNEQIFEQALMILFEESYRAYNLQEPPQIYQLGINFPLITEQSIYFITKRYLDDFNNHFRLGNGPLLTFSNLDHVLNESMFQGTNIEVGRMSRGWHPERNGWDVNNGISYLIPTRSQQVIRRESQDLGPVNGPNPIQEFIKALYIATPLLVMGHYYNSSDRTSSIFDEIAIRLLGGKKSWKYHLYTRVFAPLWEEGVFRFGVFNLIPSGISSLISLDPISITMILGVSISLFAASHIVVRWLVRAYDNGWKNWYKPWGYAQPKDLSDFILLLIPSTLFTMIYLVSFQFMPFSSSIMNHLLSYLIVVFAHGAYNTAILKRWIPEWMMLGLFTLKEESLEDGMDSIVKQNLSCFSYISYLIQKLSLREKSKTPQTPVHLIDLEGAILNENEDGFDLTPEVEEWVKGLSTTLQMHTSTQDQPAPKVGFIIQSNQRDTILQLLKEKWGIEEESVLFAVTNPQEAIDQAIQNNAKIVTLFTERPQAWGTKFIQWIVTLGSGQELRVQGQELKLLKKVLQGKLGEEDKLSIQGKELVIPKETLQLNETENSLRENLHFKFQA